jgi:hypothetical protein
LLSSITEQDILDPLQVTAGETEHTYLLLDGFKRYRCAKKLKLGMLPVNCTVQDAASGILTFIRRDESGGITTIEQAALVETLNRRYSNTPWTHGRGIRRSVMLTINNFHVSYDSSLTLREGDTVSIITLMS